MAKKTQSAEEAEITPRVMGFQLGRRKGGFSSVTEHSLNMIITIFNIRKQ
jgi:hypothetical protein